MDKRTIIAILLSVGVLFGYPYLMEYINPPQPKTGQVQNGETVKLLEDSPLPGAGENPYEPEQGAGQGTPDVKEELSTIETPLYTVVFTNRGAGVSQWVMKKHRESLDENSAGIDLAATIATNNSFKTRLAANGVTEELVFSVPKGAVLTKDDEAEFVFTAMTKGGLKVVKKYTVNGSSYILKTDLSIINASEHAYQGSIETLITANVAGKDATGYHQGPIISTGEGLTRQTVKQDKLSGQNVIWLGLETKYFLSALLPVTEVPMSWTGRVLSDKYSSAGLSVALNLPPKTASNFSYTSFLGPKEYDLLVNQGLGLQSSIEFGYFSVMAKPMLVALNFVEKYLGNYGLAIILITVLIKIVFYPLSKHSLKSMRDMQKLQPQLAAIKEKHKGNKEKMNKELMEMYKRYKVNPLGGCLPMVLQIPVFIALYEVLYVAIELRHAPLFLWIQDLSAKDPYYITPLIMGATMFLQQKMTPSTMDPNQAKIMLIMPVVFTFMFLSFPSGLVLYWLMNNILTVGQQYYIQKSPSKAGA